MSPDELRRLIAGKTADDPNFAVAIVDALLAASATAGASDLHLLPTADRLDVRWRIDGVLQPLAVIPKSLSSNVVTRLKVLARLLTYQTSIPQEGRIAGGQQEVEVRVSTFPTVFGEKVVARNLPHGPQKLERLTDLALPAPAIAALSATITETSGAIVIAGPAGSGKTTSAYACLREIMHLSGGARSIASLEDPVETLLSGVAQSQVAEAAGFDLLTGLRSLVRQDPEVIFIGEIRDPQAAGVAMQAALTGQLVLTTFHGSDAATAASRLADMGVPPYVLRSGVRTIVAQRLVRRLCACAVEGSADAMAQALGLSSASVRRPAGCDACRGAGYAGRLAVAEVLDVNQPAVARAVLERCDASAVRQAGIDSGMRPLRRQAVALVEQGVTSPEELVRVFGVGGTEALISGSWVNLNTRGAAGPIDDHLP
jgi:type II secretory ATPase GspE/PulE/Tfp pilus assembly ATPase PilB-like protein